MENQSSTEEYRCLTFLFCDLVDSTPLSQALDHEEWRTVLSQFQMSCTQQVADRNGVIYESHGDGFLFYFTHTALCAREAVVGCIGTDGLVSNVSDGTPMGYTLDFYRQIPDTPTPYGQALTMLIDAMAETRSAA